MRIDQQSAIIRLNSGGVVALPTETVYGLAASLRRPRAIERVFRLKGRPADNPLIVHISSSDQILPYVQDLPPLFDFLKDKYWPGALTFILPAVVELVPEIVRAGLPTIGVRMPAQLDTLRVISATGPLVMPSANLSGRPSATSAIHVEEDFGNEFPVLDGGDCPKGIESTILLFSGSKWVVARQGAVSIEDIENTLGYRPDYQQEGKKPLCPGQLYRHYSPKALLVPLDSEKKQVVVGFSDREYPWAVKVYSFGSIKNPEKVAKRLYMVLRRLDQDQISEAQLDMEFPNFGLWSTIRQRLQKALFQRF